MMLSIMGHETRTAHDGEIGRRRGRELSPRRRAARHRVAEAEWLRGRAAHSRAALGRVDVSHRRHGMGAGRGPAALVRGRAERAHGQARRSRRRSRSSWPNCRRIHRFRKPLTGARNRAKVRKMLSCHGQEATHAYRHSLPTQSPIAVLMVVLALGALRARSRRRCRGPRRTPSACPPSDCSSPRRSSGSTSPIGRSPAPSPPWRGAESSSTSSRSVCRASSQGRR